MSLMLGSVAGGAAANTTMRLGGSAIKKIVEAVRAGRSISSLADLAKPLRVEPLMLVDQELADHPAMPDISRHALSTYIGYYTLGFSALMQVGRIDTLKVMDAMNPNRSFGSPGKGFREAVFSKESYSMGLPSMESYEQPMDSRVVVSVEAGDKEKRSISGGIDDETYKKFYEIDDLAVGKLINVELKDGKEAAKVPVMIRLLPTQVPSKVMTHIFTATSKNATWKERYHLWRAGQIRLVKDMMLQLDLIDDHRRALMNDTSNAYMAVSQRRTRNILKAGGSGTPSMADASNIAVISKETAKDIGREMHGKLSSLSVRKRIFDSTYLILLIVVDEQWERLTVYHRGLDQASELSFRDIKGAEKGKGPDITEVLKAYQLGATPSI